MRLDSFSKDNDTNRDKIFSFSKLLFILIFLTVRVDARCFKYDFWNPGKFLDRNRSGKFLVEK